MMCFASSEEGWPFCGIVQTSSSVLIADYSYQLATVGDHFDNLHIMNVRRQHLMYDIIKVYNKMYFRHTEPGAYISENSTHYFLPDWAYLGQESCQNTVKEYSEHKIKAIFELSTLENPYIDPLFGLIYEF